MEKYYITTRRVLAFVAFICATSYFKSQTTFTYNFTGSTQTFVVPSCVSTISLDVKGAQGGLNASGLIAGGLGGSAFGIVTVTPGDVLNIYVGGTNGYNGGGTPGPSLVGTSPACPSAMGGYGGGASDIRINGVALSDRVIVGAGGGGGGGDRSNTCGRGTGGGGGGGYYGGGGGCGYPQNSTTVAVGGSQTAGGSGGISTLSSAQNGLPGTLGTGGNGGSETGTNQGGANSAFPGGVGGGLTGGPGQQPPTNIYTGQSGAGGSSYFGSLSNGITSSGVRTGNGIVTISYVQGLIVGITSSASQVICSGANTNLSTSLTLTSYTWSPGNSNASSINVSPTSTSSYSLSGSLSSCPVTGAITITVSPGQPTLSIVSSTTQTCFGKTATLTASGALTYTWSHSVANGVSFYPSATTTYTVSGQNGCGITTAVSTISVTPLSVTAVTSATAVCTNKTATLSVTAAATSYTWQPGNIIGTSSNLIINPSVTTVYTITASDGTCSGVTNISIQADPVPTITSSSSSSIICPGGSINLSATGGINYTWMPGNISGANVSVTPTISTLYNVVGDNTFGCLNNSSQVIVVGTQPNVIVNTSNSTICQGGSATLTASGTHTYSWVGGPTTTVYVVTPAQPTVYTVVGTNTSSTCSDTKTIAVDVFDPTVTVTGNFTICNGGAAIVTANAIGASGYTWNPGNILLQNTSFSPPGSTTYTVSTISSINNVNCPISGTVLVVVNPNPTVTAVPTKSAICAKETNTITAGGASTYTWITTNTTVVGPSVTVTSNNAAVIVYTITGVNSFGCEASVTVPMSISACAGLDQATLSSRQLLVYPNPNNGEFVIQSGTEMKLSLMNELGQEIKQIQLNEGNNFKVSIIELPNGIYFITGNDLSRKIIINK